MTAGFNFPPNSTAEEATLLSLCNQDYTAVANTLVNDLQAGQPPALLSIAGPDLLYGLASATYNVISAQPETRLKERTHLANTFRRYQPAAEAGDPAAISALPKFATSIGHLVTSLELTLDMADKIREWRTNRPYLQFIGSFNPQHIGHRFSISRTLNALGEHASGTVQVVANHPIKKDSLPPYSQRFRQGQERIYDSSLLDPTRVTLLDVPLGLGLAKQGDAQIALIAAVTGDSRKRWLVGSDKFMTDVKNVRDGKALDKAGVRFSNVQLFVARRSTEGILEVEEGAEYVREEFGAEIIILPEITDELILQASASNIRKLRAKGHHIQADRIEHSDLASYDVSRLRK